MAITPQKNANALRGGRLYVMEGPDGVGKSTLARTFADQLRALGIRCELLAFPGNEPGTLGHHVYHLHHDLAGFGIASVHPTSLQLLHVAAHIDLIERRIKPLLNLGISVVLDRFWWSTWVYGLEFGVDRDSLTAMVELERQYWRDAVPTAIFVIHRDLPFRAEHDSARFDRLNARYLELMDNSQGQRAHTVPNTGSVQEATTRMLALVQRSTGLGHDSGEPSRG